MRPHPMEVIYRATVPNSDSEKVPTKDFGFGFRFPSPTFSNQPGVEFEASVQWVEQTKSIIVTAQIGDILIDYWEGFDNYVGQLAAQIEPYLAGTMRGGSLGALPVGEGKSFHQVVPAYQFTIVCPRATTTEDIGPVYSKILYDRAALALWLSRSIFSRTAKGERLSADDRARLLACEYGSFALSLKEKEDEEQLVPHGMYENLYGRGLDKKQ